MAWMSEMGRRLVALVRWRRLQRDLAEEMRLHVELRAEEERARGLTPEAARRAAQRSFGNATLVREASTDAWGWSWLLALFHDTRFALRTMRRSPGFTAVAVLALALGIGANTAIYSVVNAVLLRSLPYADEDRLVVVLHGGQHPVAPANFLDWREQSRAFERMGAAQYWTANLLGEASSEQITALQITSDIMPLLGVQPLHGRLFTPGEDVPGNDRSVILGHALWQRRFSADPGVVGRTLNLSGVPFTVVGVMPEGFRFAPFWARAEMWVPLAFSPEVIDSRTASSLRLFARLRPGVSLDAARADIAAITGRLEREFPGTNRDVTVVPLKEKVVGPIRPQLVVLLCAVAFVLFIACANLAHLLLARAAARQRENAVRSALGASRSRLIRQSLTESLLFAVLGGGAGLLLALWGVPVLVALQPGDIPRLDEVGVDGHALLFMAAVSLVAGLAVGVVPAVVSSRVDLAPSLKDGGRGASDGADRTRLRGLLVVSQVALTLVLLVGAGLMLRTFAALRAIDPGFDPDSVVTMTVSPAGSPEAAPQRRAGFFQELVQRVEALPGVASVSAINHLPLAGDTWHLPYAVAGRPDPPPGDEPRAVYRVVLPGYFATMRIPLVRGRDISARDTLDSPDVVVINERLATTQWPGEDPIGKRIQVATAESVLTVVGVVKDTRQEEWSAPPEDEVYLPFLQSETYLGTMPESRLYLTLVVRTTVDPAATVPAIERAVRSHRAQITLSEIQTMRRVVDEANARPRFYLVLLAAFAGLALTLAFIGIYGVMSYSVSQRTHEIGIRMALGARRADVLRLVLRRTLAMTAAGIAIGLAASLALVDLMASLVYGVSPVDAPTFAAVAGLLGAVAFAATYIPARRATRVSPMVSLRSE
jgi:putative ABC transport system permease protein